MNGPGISYHLPPRDVGELFVRATYLADCYSRSADGIVANPHTTVFTLTGLLERANCTRVKGGIYLNRGRDAALADAKYILCRRLRTMHLDCWEAENRPSLGQIRRLMEQVGSGSLRVAA